MHFLRKVRCCSMWSKLNFSCSMWGKSLAGEVATFVAISAMQVSWGRGGKKEGQEKHWSISDGFCSFCTKKWKRKRRGRGSRDCRGIGNGLGCWCVKQGGGEERRGRRYRDRRHQTNSNWCYCWSIRGRWERRQEHSGENKEGGIREKLEVRHSQSHCAC